jgi:uncharacterized membrane protein
MKESDRDDFTPVQAALGVTVSMGIILGASLGFLWDKVSEGIAAGIMLGAAVGFLWPAIRKQSGKTK